MDRIDRRARAWRRSRAWGAAVAFAAFAWGAHGQPEVAGQGPTATGGPVPTSVSVPQARLDAAGSDSKRLPGSHPAPARNAGSSIRASHRVWALHRLAEAPAPRSNRHRPAQCLPPRVLLHV